ncbi:MAG: putative sulfate exporter family transporter [Planctomycetales bacterium]|nr:putative sulfate exporter family transporter [Planctomycetales bacterium]
MSEPNENPPASSSPASASPATSSPRKPGLHEDWTAAYLGLLILVVSLSLALVSRPEGTKWNMPAAEAKSVEWKSPVKGWLGKPGTWTDNPVDSLRKTSEQGDVTWQWKPLVGAFGSLLVIGALAYAFRADSVPKFLIAFPALFLLATLSYVMAGQSVVKNYNLEYALWALLVGLVIANTVGTPKWLDGAVSGELYIKLGLVLLGAEVLFGRLLALGLPGVCVAWVVTPIVLISTYVFGQKVLKIPSRSLNMVISADMSVCGVSAAIATAAACKAKKEELSLAVGLSLSFTVMMMVVMPRVVQAMGLDPMVGGAWIGGTIDSTGAVTAAGEALGPQGSETAVTVKMIQNILIGVTAFCVAVYWTRFVESGDAANSTVGVSEIWRRFPKFVLGFLAASAVCSAIFAASAFGEVWIGASTDAVTKSLRGWLFCLAFVCIGLDTNFRQLLPYLKSGKPMVLYVCGQSLNILLTLGMSYLMFGVLKDYFALNEYIVAR